MDLRSTQLKDTYGNLVTTGTTAGAPTSGGLQNGQGTLLSSVGIGTNTPTDMLNISSASNQIGLDTGDQTTYGTLDVGHFTNGAFIGTQAGSNSASNVLRLGTSGTERLRIDSSGNVGMNAIPENSAGTWRNYQLGSLSMAGRASDSAPDSMFGTNFKFTTANAEQRISAHATSRIFFNDDVITFQNAGSDTAGSAISWNERMRIDSSGNVLVGKTATSGIATGNIEVSNSSSASLQIEGGTHEWSMLVSSSADALRFYQDSDERMRIDSSGNVGIGETDPDSKLHLKSASAELLELERTSVGAYRLAISASDAFSIYDVGQDSDRLTIDSSGNVGIGTSPSTNLEIDGGTSTTVFINSSTHSAGTANEAKLQFGYGHSGSPDSIGYIKLNENSTNSFDGTMTFGVPYNNGSGGSATRDALVIKNDGNVGIGISPSKKLTVFGTGVGNATVQIEGEGGADPYINFLANNTQHWSLGVDDSDSDKFKLSEHSALGTNDYLVVDTSGNVLVGKTASNYASEGIELRPTEVLVTKDSGTVLSLRRNTSDGTIISFAKDGTSVGHIGTYLGNLHIGTTNGSDSFLGFRSNVIVPAGQDGTDRDNIIDLGYSSARFDDIYATNGTIQTSDNNEKQDIEELDDAELRVAQKAKTLLRKYRWKSSVEEKGDDARIHFGIIAQDLEQAFIDEGLDAGRYGMFIKSTWTNEDGEEQTRLGVRYNQLLAFIISAI